MVCEDGGVFTGGHYFFWKSKVEKPGEDLLDLLHDSKGGLRGLKRVRYGYHRVQGVGPVLLERFRPSKRGKHGSLNVRFDLRAEAGETAFQYVARGKRVARKVLAWLEKERKMAFGDLVECSKPHLTRLNDPDANDAAKLRLRVTTRDPYGKVMMDASHGPEWEAEEAKSMAARGRLAGNVEWMLDEMKELNVHQETIGEVLANLTEATKEQAQAITAVIQAMKDQSAVLDRLAQTLAGAMQPKPPKPPQPPPESEPGGMFG